MTICRSIIKDALGLLRALAPGDEPHADEYTLGVEMLGDLIYDIHEARGPLTDIDASSSTQIPSENQRVRVPTGMTYVLTLPNSVPIYTAADPNDYGFRPTDVPAQQGSTAVADGVAYRAPRDGTRIEIVGTTSALYFYRADINSWQPGTGLTLDGESPLNPRYNSALGARLAERLAPRYPDFEPDRFFLARLTRANIALLDRPGVAREPVQAEYF